MHAHDEQEVLKKLVRRKRKTRQPHLIEEYYLHGNAEAIEIALRNITGLEELPFCDGGSYDTIRQTTRGEHVSVLKVTRSIIKNLWAHHREGAPDIEFTAYQLLSNGLLRVLKEPSVKKHDRLAYQGRKLLQTLPRRNLRARE